jgi:hypothetical protein
MIFLEGDSFWACTPEIELGHYHYTNNKDGGLQLSLAACHSGPLYEALMHNERPSLPNLSRFPEWPRRRVDNSIQSPTCEL